MRSREPMPKHSHVIALPANLRPTRLDSPLPLCQIRCADHRNCNERHEATNGDMYPTPPRIGGAFRLGVYSQPLLRRPSSCELYCVRDRCGAQRSVVNGSSIGCTGTESSRISLAAEPVRLTATLICRISRVAKIAARNTRRNKTDWNGQARSCVRS